MSQNKAKVSENYILHIYIYMTMLTFSV